RLSVYRSALEAKWRMGARNHPGRDAKIYLGKSKTCLSDQIRRMDSRLETAPAGVCGVTRGQGSARSGEGDIARASSLCATGHLAWLSRIWDFYQRAECLLSPQGPSRTGIKCLCYIRVVTISLSFCTVAILICRHRSLASPRLADSRRKLSLKLRLNDCMNSVLRSARGN